jgi:hypothetical protein
MSKWYAPNAVRHSHGLEETKRPLIQLLLVFYEHNRDQLQIQTHSEMSWFAICNEACPTQWRVASIKASRKSDF